MLEEYYRNYKEIENFFKEAELDYFIAIFLLEIENFNFEEESLQLKMQKKYHLEESTLRKKIQIAYDWKLFEKEQYGKTKLFKLTNFGVDYLETCKERYLEWFRR